MSYSRWGHSRWYTYWGKRESVIEDRGTALFVVCPIAEFTAEELRADMDSCIAIAVDAEDESTFFVTSVEKNELRKYMHKFLADVDARYPGDITIERLL